MDWLSPILENISDDNVSGWGVCSAVIATVSSARSTVLSGLQARGNTSTLSCCETKATRGADACLSPCTWKDRTCRIAMVRHGQGECNKEILCTTVEQESERLEQNAQRSKKLVAITKCCASCRIFCCVRSANFHFVTTLESTLQPALFSESSAVLQNLASWQYFRLRDLSSLPRT